MPECVERLAGIHVELEAPAFAVVVNLDDDPVRSWDPEQANVDAVPTAVIELDG
jgi:hypothetical protein